MGDNWIKTGELSPAGKALEKEGQDAVDKVHADQIAERKKAAYVKPTHPAPLRSEESD